MQFNNIFVQGQVVKLEDSSGNSWDFGVKSLFADRQVLCELLNNASTAPAETATGLKLCISGGTGTYEAQAHITWVSRDGSEYRFEIGNEFKFVQRREFFRLTNPQISALCIIHSEPVTDVKITDISGGGIGLVIDRERPIKHDTLIELTVTLSDIGTIHANARASYVSTAKEAEGYFVGARFSKIAKADRAKIMKFVFAEQIERKRKEAQQALNNSSGAASNALDNHSEASLSMSG